MARDCTDIDDVLYQINQRLRKLEKSDSEKKEEIGRLNRIIGQKDVEIHGLKVELASTKSELADAKERIKELEKDGGDDDATPGYSGKPEKNSSNGSIPYCKCCGRPLDNVGYRKIRKTQVIDLKFVVETSEERYYEKVCQCGCVNNCDAPNCRIKYGDNIRALVTYLNVVQCIPFKRIAELISDLSGRKISEGDRAEHPQGKQCQV